MQRGTLKYGVAVTIAVKNQFGITGNFTLSTGLQPQTGWGFVNLTSVNTTSQYRITASPDLAIGDQLAWGNITPSGTATINPDATYTASVNAGLFEVEANDGTGWGAQGLQTIANYGQNGTGSHNIPPSLGHYVTTRQFSLLEMVSREWGSEFRAPDHRVYNFDGGARGFDSTDQGQTGIYRKH